MNSLVSYSPPFLVFKQVVNQTWHWCRKKIAYSFRNLKSGLSEILFIFFAWIKFSKLSRLQFHIFLAQLKFLRGSIPNVFQSLFVFLKIVATNLNIRFSWIAVGSFEFSKFNLDFISLFFCIFPVKLKFPQDPASSERKLEEIIDCILLIIAWSKENALCAFFLLILTPKEIKALEKKSPLGF